MAFSLSMARSTSSTRQLASTSGKSASSACLLTASFDAFSDFGDASPSALISSCCIVRVCVCYNTPHNTKPININQNQLSCLPYQSIISDLGVLISVFAAFHIRLHARQLAKDFLFDDCNGEWKGRQYEIEFVVGVGGIQKDSG